MMGRYYNPDDFVIQYPGIYPENVQPFMDEYFERVRYVNETEVNGADIVAGNVTEPKLTAKITLTDNLIRFYNEKYAPEYKLNTDVAMAKKYGYKDIFTMIGATACDDAYNFMFPPQSRDTVLVSQINSWIENKNPAYAGDTLYMIRDKVEVFDLTPQEGSIYRHIYAKNFGTVYNQAGVVISKVMFSLMESTKLYKDECLPKPRHTFGFPDMWEDPDWFSRPLHVYTDEDYEYFKDLWKNEVVRGEEPLFWEDVAVGDVIPTGTFGPIKDSVIPMKPYGMGVSGSRNLKEYFLNPELEAQMVVDEVTGIKQMPDPEINTPPMPDGIELPVRDVAGDPDDGDSASDIETASIHSGPQLKIALLNFMGRDIATAYVENFVGYHGKIKNVRWNIMPADTHAALGKPVAVVEDYVNFIQKVPGKESTTLTIHGLTTDVAIMNAQVIGKTVVDQEYLIKVIVWIEDINKEAWFGAEFDIALPSKKA